MVAKLNEMDMIVAELERANNRVAATERRNVRPILKIHDIYLLCGKELLRAEIESVRNGSDVANRYVNFTVRCVAAEADSSRQNCTFGKSNLRAQL